MMLLIERDGRRTLRALDERCPERTADAATSNDPSYPAHPIPDPP